MTGPGRHRDRAERAPAPPPPPRQRVDAAAERDAEAARHGGPLWGSAVAGQRARRGPEAGLGRPLDASLRAPLERRLGRDLTSVRVHDDATAAALARDRGARAFAHGRDLFFERGAFRPEVEEGRRLIEHELAHVAQQDRAGGPPVVLADRPQPGGGLGAAPPDATFELAEGKAAEDAHLLFGHDAVAVDEASLAAVVAALGERTEAVDVEIHGYASEDGEPEYNRNLSAHRAAAAQRALLSHLPANSRTRLFAHGETGAFGDRQGPNRRVGIKLRPLPADETVEAPSLALQLGNRLSLGTGPLIPPGGRFHLDVPPLRLDDADTASAPVPSPWTLRPTLQPEPVIATTPPAWVNLPPINPRCPFAPGSDRMDWAGIVEPLTLRGSTLSTRHAVALGDSWQAAACTYAGLLAPVVGPDLAATLAARGADLGMSNAMDSVAYRDNPNAFDLYDKELRRQGIDTTIIPVSDIVIGLIDFLRD